MHITLREANGDDASVLADLCLTVQDLHVEAVPHVFKPLESGNADLINFYVERLKEGFMAYIAEIENEAVGFFLAQILTRPDGVYTYSMHRFHIDQMSVKASHQKQGVGKALMNKAFELAREAKVEQVSLSVWAFNSGAIAFYDAMGFETAYQTMYAKLEE